MESDDAAAFLATHPEFQAFFSDQVSYWKRQQSGAKALKGMRWHTT